MPRATHRLLPLLVLLLSLPGPAVAVRVEGLYRAEVEVLDKGSAARAEGFRRALEQVLIKVTGDSAVIEDPAVESMLATPARYVQQYRYEEIEDAAADEDTVAEAAPAETGSGTDEDEPVPAYRLEVMFGETQIERTLRASEVVVWGPYRPQVLVWLAYDDGNRRALVAADDETAMDEALHASADTRGLPLLLPLLDTEDRQRIEFLDVQGGFHDAVRAASERYRASSVLVGHVYPGNGGWRGEWTLLSGDDRSGWLTRAEGAEQAVQAGIAGLADRLAAELAGREGEIRRVRLRVLGAERLGDYARLSDYLERLPRVDARHLVRVQPREVLFELELRGRLADLERAIALDDLLVPETPSADDAADMTTDPGTGVVTLGADAPEVRAAPGAEAQTPVTDPTQPGTDERRGELDPVDRRDELVYRLAG